MPYALCLIGGFAANAAPQIKAPTSGNAAAAAGVRTQNDAYQSALMATGMSTQNITGDAAIDASIAALPVRVASIDLARDIVTGRGEFNIGRRDLENCAMIFPAGRFAWDRPTAGTRAGGNITCVAEVEMRKIYGNNDIILARAMVAAGDSIECNIDHFPESGYTAEAFKTEFPEDQEPSLSKVRRRMDKEQKKDAGKRTLTAAALAAGAGAMLAGEGNRWQGAGIGAVAGGGTMYASTQAGHVGGAVIMGTAVNAAAGGLVGNIMGVGDTTWLVDDCPGAESFSCLFGSYVLSDQLEPEKRAFYNIREQRILVCNTDMSGCDYADLVDTYINVTPPPSSKLTSPMSISEFQQQQLVPGSGVDATDEKHCLKNNTMTTDGCDAGSQTWVQIFDAEGGKPNKVSSRYAAVCKGWTATNKEKNKWKNDGKDSKGNACSLYSMAPDGNMGVEIPGAKFSNFKPYVLNASDGKIIDISHPGRMTATITGAVSGGILGGWSAYEGANEEIQERWVAAVREYKDSLERIHCSTGTRPLSPYNGIVVIPNVRQ